MKKLSVVLLVLVLALLVSGNAFAQQNYEVNLNSPTLDVNAYDGCLLHAQLYALDGAGLLEGAAAYEAGGNICYLFLYIGGTTTRNQYAEHDVGYIWIDEGYGSAFVDARYTVFIDYPSSGD